MNISDAAYQTVHDYPGGSESLAPRIGMSAAVLRNKVNPHNTTHHLTLAEASVIIGVTGDHRILHALAGTHDHVAQRTEAPDSGSMIGSLLAAAAAKGDLAEILSAAMADSRISPNEAADISRACAAIQAAITAVSAHAHKAARAPA